ncbi:hypothetical protein D2E26_0186 [Bifidobacterium dolichotidis]|uniref:BspA family leucine-rich repeat surface protein n=1 Tax=Bifidobacterium dolichotidis TaxID=2306976 RepID=A0A430FRZ4_9BIFI|nr:BspA family leucine-rich repeat surface protein [Bifidobacterium dolichotidis]RSX55623.1 hypothetical protein D2E26_0186 [Bifidobacterium dolichotidis]
MDSDLRRARSHCRPLLISTRMRRAKLVLGIAALIIAMVFGAMVPSGFATAYETELSSTNQYQLEQHHTTAALAALDAEQTHNDGPATEGNWGGVDWTYNTRSKVLSIAPKKDATLVDNDGPFLTADDAELATKMDMRTVRFMHKVTITDASQLAYMFEGACSLNVVENLWRIQLSEISATQPLDLTSMFAYTAELHTDFARWKIGNRRIIAREMFRGSHANTFEYFHLPWGNIEDAYYMFAEMPNLLYIDFDSQLSESNFGVRNAEGMFYGCTALEQVIWNMSASNMINMNEMFKYCFSLLSVDFLSTQGSQQQSMTGMFEGCHHLQEVNFQDLPITPASMQVGSMFLDDNDVRAMTMSIATLRYLYDQNYHNPYDPSWALPCMDNAESLWTAKGQSRSWKQWMEDTALEDTEILTFTRVL